MVPQRPVDFERALELLSRWRNATISSNGRIRHRGIVGCSPLDVVRKDLRWYFAKWMLQSTILSARATQRGSGRVNEVQQRW